MQFKKITKRVDPARLGIDIEQGLDLDAAKQEDGPVDLAEVFDVPDKAENPLQTTVNRLTEKSGLADEKAYQKEYQLKVAHQVLINGGSSAKIAEILGCSLTQARALKNELNNRLIQEVKTLDKNKVVGQALMLYDHVQAKFLQMAQVDPKAPEKNLRSKIEALKGALQAQSDKQKMLKEVGFYREPLNSGTAGDNHSDGANELREMAQMVISGDDYEIISDEDAEEDNVELL